MDSFVIGLDVGGTNIKLGIVSSTGRVIAKNVLPTKSFVRDKRKLIEVMISSCRDIIQRHNLSSKNILGIGIGLPGLVDFKRGMVRTLINIYGWKDVPLKKILEKVLQKPVFVDNDVNLMALGEWKFGAGRGYENIFCVTLGTGVGGAFILNNELYRGEGFTAGEFGHVPLNEHGSRCGCGGYGCLEQYLGNRYLTKRAREIFRIKDITLQKVGDLAGRGDRKALDFWQDAAIHLGNGLVNVVNLFNPRRIVIGGGVANNFRFFSKTLKGIVKKRAMKIPAAMAEILPARLGEDAGIIGAQVLVNGAINE